MDAWSPGGGGCSNRPPNDKQNDKQEMDGGGLFVVCEDNTMKGEDLDHLDCMSFGYYLPFKESDSDKP